MSKVVKAALENLAAKGMWAQSVSVGMEALHLAGVDLHGLAHTLSRSVGAPLSTVLPGLIRSKLLEVQVSTSVAPRWRLRLVQDWAGALRTAMGVDMRSGVWPSVHTHACFSACGECVSFRAPECSCLRLQRVRLVQGT